MAGYVVLRDSGRWHKQKERQQLHTESGPSAVPDWCRSNELLQVVLKTPALARSLATLETLQSFFR
jgi:hypothetical protein